MLFLDMDGVLADFELAASKGIAGYNPCYNQRPKSLWSEDDIRTDKQVREFMSKPGAFRYLTPMPGCRSLWEYCKDNFDTHVLTARPKIEDIGERVKSEKLDWCRINLPGFKDSQFNCVIREEKAKFAVHEAEEGNILVDDLRINCREWYLSGGSAVWHFSAEHTIDRLEREIKGYNI